MHALKVPLSQILKGREFAIICQLLRIAILFQNIQFIICALCPPDPQSVIIRIWIRMASVWKILWTRKVEIWRWHCAYASENWGFNIIWNLNLLFSIETNQKNPSVVVFLFSKRCSGTIAHFLSTQLSICFYTLQHPFTHYLSFVSIKAITFAFSFSFWERANTLERERELLWNDN